MLKHIDKDLLPKYQNNMKAHFVKPLCHVLKSLLYSQALHCKATSKKRVEKLGRSLKMKVFS